MNQCFKIMKINANAGKISDNTDASFTSTLFFPLCFLSSFQLAVPSRPPSLPSPPPLLSLPMSRRAVLCSGHAGHAGAEDAWLTGSRLLRDRMSLHIGLPRHYAGHTRVHTHTHAHQITEDIFSLGHSCRRRCGGKRLLMRSLPGVNS